MSDTTEAAVVEAPSGGTAGLAAPETPPEQTEAQPEPQTEAEAEVQLELERGKGRSGALRNARKRAERAAATRAKAEAARERALGQPRKEAGTSEGGQFAAETAAVTPEGAEQESAASTEAGTEQAPAATEASSPEAVTTTPEVDGSGTDQAPDGWVDIPLPENHPLRARGRTHIRALKDQEADVRNGINAAVRLRETEAERDRLVREHALLEARAQAQSGHLPNPETDPSVQQLLQQIREAPGFGDEMAERVLNGLRADAELAVLKAEQQADSEIALQRTTASIAGEIEAKAGDLFKVWSEAGEVQRFLHGPRGLLAQYFEAVDARNARDGVNTKPSMPEFFEWAKPVYASDPRVRAQIERFQRDEKLRSEEAIRAKVRRELEEEQQKKAAEAAARHAKLPPTSRSMPASSTPATEATEEREAPRPGTYRQAAKQRIRERFAPQ